MSGGGYLKFRNDRGVPEICIGVREFKCIGVSPPQDHPHVYINMGSTDTILCPYCATRFRFDPRLTPLDADPPDSFFADHNPAAPETPSPRNRRKARKGKDGDSRILPRTAFWRLRPTLSILTGCKN